MKSTYKLIGAFWDGMPVETDTETIEPYDPDIASPDVPENLFDQACFRRVIPLSELLGAPQIAKLDTLIHRLDNCDEVFLELDYQPRASGLVPRLFHRKRTLQALAYTRTKLPHARVRLMQGADGKGFD